MEIKIPKFTDKGNNKRFKNRKPYWNGQLRELWNIMGENENNFISYIGKKNDISALRREYTQARESFDKALKRAERAYKKSVANDIETMSSTNPNEFWNKI